MKKKISLFLAMLMALTMVMGINVTAFAASVSFYTEQYGGSPDTGWSSDYKTDDLSLRDATKIYYYYCTENPAECNAYVHYIVNGVDVGYSETRVYVNPGGLASVLINNELIHITNDDLFTSAGVDGWHFWSDNSDADFPNEDYHLYIYWGTTPNSTSNAASGVQHGHEHHFQWQTITEPTKDTDGLEGEVCSCGAIRNTQPISAFAYALYQYAIPMINAAKPGQTITFEFGEFNSFPKAFMEKLVEKNGQNVTFVFHYKWNHVKQEITIPAGNPIDLNFDWYGPAKMAELYGAN